MRNWLKVGIAAGVGLVLAMSVTPATLRAQGSATILKPADVEKLIPATVFYRGQTAVTELRNSGGVKFGDGFFILASMVDTGGYSTAISSKYQAYFITEVPIQVAGEKLAAGVYGVGFIDGDRFLVTDVGGHDVFSVGSTTDSDLKRPVPLQVLADAGGGFRLYCGRKYVVLRR
jgi:hypothetical protein